MSGRNVSGRNVSGRNIHAPPLVGEYRLRRVGGGA